MSARPICGDCDVCLRRTNALLRVPPPAAVMPGVRPTAAALEKHAKRFGSAGVRETAAQYGLSVAVTEEPKKKKWRR